jgi:hypothetical protein
MCNLNELRAECLAICAETLDTIFTWAQAESDDFTLRQAEQQVHKQMREVARSTLERVMRLRGTGYQGTHLTCTCEETMKFVNHRSKQVLTLLGTLKLPRAYYHCANCHTGLIPLDEKIGLGASGLSEMLERVLGRLGAEVPFNTSVEILEEITVGLTVSPTTCQKTAEQLGVEIAALRQQEREAVWAGEDNLMPAHPPQRLYITLDGTTVHTLDGWREIKIAAIYDTLKQLGSVEPGREEEQANEITYAATFAQAEAFGDVLYLEAYQRGIENAAEVIWIGDGARWIWNLAQTHCARAVRIVDWFHANERLWLVGKELYGEGTPRTKGWVEKRLQQLHDGDISSIIYELESYTDLTLQQQEIVRQAVHYFDTNRNRMRYKEFRAKGYHIGSGVVESACKHLIGAREKQAGMRWSLQGAENIAQLRTCIRNRRYDAFWAQRRPPKRRYQRQPTDSA